MTIIPGRTALLGVGAWLAASSRMPLASAFGGPPAIAAGRHRQHGPSAALSPSMPSRPSSGYRPPSPRLRFRRPPLLASVGGLDEIDQEELTHYMNSDLTISFEEYRKREKLKRYLSRCPIFHDCSSEDSERLIQSIGKVNIGQIGTKVIVQGRTDEHSMYFLSKGRLACVDEESGVLYTTYENEGEYFGELALLFDQPRAATIVTTSPDVTLYRLNRTAFAESVVDSPVYDTARDMMLKKYAANRLRDVFANMSVGEIEDLVRAKAYQVFKPLGGIVGDGTALRSFALGSAATVVASLAAPATMVTAAGAAVPRLLDLSRAVPVPSRRLASFLLAASAIFGARGAVKDGAGISDGAEDAASASARAVAWLTASFWIIGESTLIGRAGIVGNAWSRVMRPALLLVVAASLFQTFRAALVTPEGNREYSSGEGSAAPARKFPSVLAGLSSSLVFFMPVTLGLLTAALPLLGTRTRFDSLAVPFLTSHSHLVANLCLCWQLSLALCFRQSTRAKLLAAGVCFDPVRTLLWALGGMASSRGRDAAQDVTGTACVNYLGYLMSVQKKWRVLSALGVAWMAVLARRIWTIWMKSADGDVKFPDEL
uniref:Cyclic nucleotide-binding domain-containing protein n=1 Tax=Odontella aurita TaxID=265563 RepID=A0A7S4MDT6_9STRA|mmetsp:Transcript_19174/g.55793  ORF Transcript_19174/g.55793 Transcript_19174/m.55793 type:complete len:600 (+) Transcript_19174:164-1963(+)